MRKIAAALALTLGTSVAHAGFTVQDSTPTMEQESFQPKRVESYAGFGPLPVTPAATGLATAGPPLMKLASYRPGTRVAIASDINSESERLRQQRQSIIRRVEAFVVQYHRQMARDISGIRYYFASAVEYGDRGVIGRAEMIEEQLVLAKSCAARDYKVDFENARLRPVQGREDRVEIYFHVDTYCGRGSKQQSRRWESFLTLDLSQPDILIEGVRGRAMNASR